MTTDIDPAASPSEPIVLDWDEFLEKFRPITNPFGANAAFDGRMLETYGQEKAHVDAAHERDPLTVWTVIADDDGDPIVVDGLRWVNRLRYIITEVARPADVSYEIS